MRSRFRQKSAAEDLDLTIRTTANMPPPVQTFLAELSHATASALAQNENLTPEAFDVLLERFTSPKYQRDAPSLAERARPFPDQADPLLALFAHQLSSAQLSRVLENLNELGKDPQWLQNPFKYVSSLVHLLEHNVLTQAQITDLCAIPTSYHAICEVFARPFAHPTTLAALIERYPRAPGALIAAVRLLRPLDLDKRRHLPADLLTPPDQALSNAVLSNAVLATVLRTAYVKKERPKEPKSCATRPIQLYSTPVLATALLEARRSLVRTLLTAKKGPLRLRLRALLSLQTRRSYTAHLRGATEPWHTPLLYDTTRQKTPTALALALGNDVDLWKAFCAIMPGSGDAPSSDVLGSARALLRSSPRAPSNPHTQATPSNPSSLSTTPTMTKPLP
jgi:hypothetical protein